MMIKLADGCHVAATEIAEVTSNFISGVINVRTKSGIGHTVYSDSRASLSETENRLVDEINRALAPQRAVPTLTDPEIDDACALLYTIDFNTPTEYERAVARAVLEAAAKKSNQP